VRRALSFIDGFIRDRKKVIEQVKSGGGLGRFVVLTLVVYLAFTALYGVAMGSFRWAHPAFLFSDFVIGGADEPGRATFTGVVNTMDEDTRSVTTEGVAADAALVGRSIRFNKTDPTPAFEIEAVEQVGPYCRITLKQDPDGPAMVADAPWAYTILAAVKVPALFLVTLLVCLPVLYVLNVAFGWRLHFVPTVALLFFALAGTSVMLVVVAPIVLFFNVLTDHYHFIMVLHVAFFALAGAYGVQTLALGLNELKSSHEGNPKTSKLLAAWLVIYMFVGCQMAWSLKPWVGTPYLTEFAAFRPSSTNFYAAVLESMGRVASPRRR
jgi:hypothetical protein